MYQGYKLGIVVPAYNEEKLIAETLNGMPPVVDRIYVVDDASTDNTPAIIKALGNERISHFKHKRNLGVGAAIVTGYKSALKDNMDIVAVMAGDNQMDPSYLPRLLDVLIANNADYVKGNRLQIKEHKRGMSPWRYLGNSLLRWLTKVASGNYALEDPQDGYTAITSQTLKRLDLDKIFHRYGYCNDMLIKLSVIKARIVEVPRPYSYSDAGSKIKYRYFIPSVSLLLLRRFLWRLKIKYLGGLKDGKI